MQTELDVTITHVVDEPAQLRHFAFAMTEDNLSVFIPGRVCDQEQMTPEWVGRRVSAVCCPSGEGKASEFTALKFAHKEIDASVLMAERDYWRRRALTPWGPGAKEVIRHHFDKCGLRQVSKADLARILEEKGYAPGTLSATLSVLRNSSKISTIKDQVLCEVNPKADPGHE